MSGLLPRATLTDVLRGRCPLVGSRLDPAAPRGLVSPLEARVQMGIPYGDILAEERSQLETLSRGRIVVALAKSLVASALGGGAGLIAPDRPFVVSAYLDNSTIEEAVEALLAPSSYARARLAYLVHPHALNLALLHRDHATRLAEADLVLPDGVGIRIAASILGLRMRHNLCGTDLVPALQREMVARGLPLMMVGGRDGVAELCASRWIEDCPGLEIPVRSHGFLDDNDIEALREAIRQVGRGVVLVGLGSPRQERFAVENLADIEGVTVLTVGGLFDYFAGQVPRAPLVWRELGLEWLFRVIQEPRRLLLRYLVGNPAFLLAAVAQRLAQRLRLLRP